MYFVNSEDDKVDDSKYEENEIPRLKSCLFPISKKVRTLPYDMKVASLGLIIWKKLKGKRTLPNCFQKKNFAFTEKIFYPNILVSEKLTLDK